MKGCLIFILKSRNLTKIKDDIFHSFSGRVWYDPIRDDERPGGHPETWRPYAGGCQE